MKVTKSTSRFTQFAKWTSHVSGRSRSTRGKRFVKAGATQEHRGYALGKSAERHHKQECVLQPDAVRMNQLSVWRTHGKVRQESRTEGEEGDA